MDLWNNWLETIKQCGTTVVDHSIFSANNQLKEVNNVFNDNLYIKSNGGSFVSLSTNEKYKKMNVQVDTCIGNDKIEVGLNAKTAKNIIPNIGGYIYILNTLFIGKNHNLHEYLNGEFKEKLYSNVSNEFLSCEKESNLAFIMSVGHTNKIMYQIGMKDGLVFAINYLPNTDDIFIVQYDNDFRLYANISGFYASFVNYLRLGINFSRLFFNLNHQNICIYNAVLGYGTEGFFALIMIKVLIVILGLYLIIEISYENGLNISLRLQQAANKLYSTSVNSLKQKYFC